jgi:hypothetical protein
MERCQKADFLQHKRDKRGLEHTITSHPVGWTILTRMRQSEVVKRVRAMIKMNRREKWENQATEDQYASIGTYGSGWLILRCLPSLKGVEEAHKLWLASNEGTRNEPITSLPLPAAGVAPYAFGLNVESSGVVSTANDRIWPSTTA